MTPERWQRVKEILAELEEMPPRAQGAWLREHYGQDEELLGVVQEFMGETELEGFMEDAAPTRLRVDREIVDPEQELGRRIGHFRLGRLLGRGGMGAVYEAFREDDFEQRVALKLALAGPRSPRILQLFHNERQILAGLKHPNIAHLLDGGTDRQGRPYFAMELVEGKPVDVYCDAHKLSLRRRLELILQVCDALQSAHQQLVVHRDIKPGNILVEADGVPKLLDFGIAKFFDPGDDPAVTQTGSRPMTLLYASPEQLQTEPVTPASDVYSMGALIYKLLTGVLPNRLESLSHLDLVLASCREVPKKASDQVVDLEPETLEQILAARGLTDVSSLRRRLSGDLDAILAKALEKKPTDRYGSMEQLSNDLRRYLAQRPVKAKQGGRLYVASKFVRRNALPLIAASAAFLLLAGLGAGYLEERGKAAAAEEQRDKMRTSIQEVLFLADPWNWEIEEEKEKSWPERILSIPEGEALDPTERLRLWARVAEVYLYRYEEDLSLEILDKHWPAFEDRFSEKSVDMADAFRLRGTARLSTGDYEGAEKDLNRAMDLAQDVGAEGVLWSAMNNLASYQRHLDLESATERFEEVLEARRRLVREGLPDVPGVDSLSLLDTEERRLFDLLSSLVNMAALRLDAGRATDTIQLADEALRLLADQGLSDEPTFSRRKLEAMVQKARGLREMGQLDTAKELLTDVVETRRAKLSEGNYEIGLAEKDLATVETDLGQTVEAEKRLQEAESVLSAWSPRSERIKDQELRDLKSLRGAVAWQRGELDAAEDLLFEAHCALNYGILIGRVAKERYQDFLAETGRPERPCPEPDEAQP